MSDLVLQLLERVSELERRLENVYRKVRVKERKDGKVIVEDETGFVSAPLTDGSLSAGNWKIDAPSDVGTQGIILSDGDPANATFWPTLPSNQHPAASTEPNKLGLIGPGGEKITIADGTFLAEVQQFKVKGNVDFEDGYVRSNGHPIDDTHKHTDVEPGPALTGPPQ